MESIRGAGILHPPLLLMSAEAPGKSLFRLMFSLPIKKVELNNL